MLKSSRVDVLLVNPPSTEVAPAVPHEVGEPIGLCYLAAALRARGLSAYVLDGFTLGLSVQQLVELTCAFDPRLCVGLSMLETSALASAAYVRDLRRAGFERHICAGNYYPTLNPERTFQLAPGLSSLIRGEGEQAFGDLVEYLDRGMNWRLLPGVCYRSESGVTNNGIAQQPPIDTIIEPVRDCLPQTIDAGGTANLVTGRGCYANCSFCSIVAFTGAAGRRYRVRDEVAVVEEMARIHRDFGVKRFLIPDDNFMLPGKHRAPRVHRLCDAIEARELDIEFTITCRADDIHDDLMTRLRSVGLVGVYLGIESFLPRRLKLFNKGLKPEANFRAFDILDRCGLFVKIGFIMYDPFISVGEITQELETLRDRVGCPPVIHTSIDNLIRHSTYPLELQAGTPVQAKMSMAGRAFETGAGYDYVFDDPKCYALARFAAALLRFEGPTFAPLRALSYRLSFGAPLDPSIRNDVEAACTAVWKEFGATHFDMYLAAVRAVQAGHVADGRTLESLVREHAARLDSIREAAWGLIHRAGLTDLERPWIRFVDRGVNETGPGDVYDPATGSWEELDAPTRLALRFWSRTGPTDITPALAQQFGDAEAARAVELVRSRVERGQFTARREVDAPLDLDEFLTSINDILADLASRRVGVRDGDVLPEEQVASAV